MQTLKQLEKEAIVKALSKHKGSRRKASKCLGISERTLYRKINDYSIDTDNLPPFNEEEKNEEKRFVLAIYQKNKEIHFDRDRNGFSPIEILGNLEWIKSVILKEIKDESESNTEET